MTGDTVAPTSSTAVDHGQLLEAATWLVNHTDLLNKRRTIWSANIDPTRPGESDLQLLDASIKRNTALTKRLKGVSEETAQALCEEILKTNQSKYVAEAVQAVVDAPIKAKDALAVAQVCSLLHQRYVEFASQLLPVLLRMLAQTRQGADAERISQSKRRALLRLLCELHLVGLLPDGQTISRLLKELSQSLEWSRDRESAANNIALLAAFAKAYAVEFLPHDVGLAGIRLPSDELSGESTDAAAMEAYAAARQSHNDALTAAANMLPSAELRSQSLAALRTGFDAACVQLVREHEGLQQAESHNAKVLNTRGELPEELSQQYEVQRKQYEALQRSVATIAEATHWRMPELADVVVRVATGTGGAAVRHIEFEDSNSSPFEDEYSRNFYELLPDLKVLVPGVLLMTKGDTTQGPHATEGPQGPSASTASPETSALGDAERVASSSTGGQGVSEGGAATEEGPAVEPSSQDATHASEETRTPADAGAGDAAKEQTEEAEALTELNAVLTRLPTCTTPERCDEVCVQYCFASGAAKAARRRLLATLVDVPYTALDVIPSYARIAATLSSVFPDIKTELVKWVDKEFLHVVGGKDVSLRSMGPRLRCTRYMGELAKFRLYPYGSLFSHLKELLDSFTGAHVEMVADLMQTAGRFLYRVLETHTRMDNMSEVMLRLKNARNLDHRLSMLVDYAYFCVKPPGGLSATTKQRTPLQQYIMYLLYDRLDKPNVKKVLKKLRKLPWHECEAYVVKVVLKAAARGRYSAQDLLAALLASLDKYHPTLTVRVVDELLETIRFGLEHPESGTYQRRVALIHLLGQLYNYGVVNSRIVFDTLYLVLACGRETPEGARALDPPTDYFRIRLICTLLTCCGQYFKRGRAHSKLQRVLLYFQRYVLSKAQPLPLDIEYQLQDLWDVVGQPEALLHTTYEEAVRAVEQLEQQEKAQLHPLSGGGGVVDSDSDDEGPRKKAGLESDDDKGDIDDKTEELQDVQASMEGDSGDEGPVTVLQDYRRAPEVDEAFEAEFSSFMRQVDAPAASLGIAGATPHAAGFSMGTPGGPGPSAATSPAPTVAFKVVLRKGGREDRSKELQVPSSTGIAAAVKAEATAEADERAIMKKLVLQANRREEEEEAEMQRAAAGAAGTGRRGGRQRGRGAGRTA